MLYLGAVVGHFLTLIALPCFWPRLSHRFFQVSLVLFHGGLEEILTQGCEGPYERCCQDANQYVAG
ncbi:MAG: hypothetical protein R2880_11235 [Deinococcales bacterium]